VSFALTDELTSDGAAGIGRETVPICVQCEWMQELGKAGIITGVELISLFVYTVRLVHPQTGIPIQGTLDFVGLAVSLGPS